MPPLVVEGITDAMFFCELVRLYLSDVTVDYMDQSGKRRIPEAVRGLRADGSVLELEFRNQDPETGGGKDQIPQAVTALIRGGGVTTLAVAQDFNSRPPDSVVESMKDVVLNLLGGAVEKTTEEKFRVQNIALRQIRVGQSVTVGVIPMGLYDDPDLDDLGITSHAMEDYLIKLLLLDGSLRRNVPRFHQLIDELIQIIKRYNVTFDSSKDLFQLVKPIIKHGFSDTGVVQWAFQNADQDILRSVIDPLFDRLERAVVA